MKYLSRLIYIVTGAACAYGTYEYTLIQFGDTNQISAAVAVVSVLEAINAVRAEIEALAARLPAAGGPIRIKPKQEATA